MTAGIPTRISTPAAARYEKSPDPRPEWHEQVARLAADQGQWFFASFHHRRLAALASSAGDAAERHTAQAEEYLARHRRELPAKATPQLIPLADP